MKKLESNGLWDKDTLVIGLDKSVRPLAYTLRKLAKLEGKELPDMKFFNFSIYDENPHQDSEDVRNKRISQDMKRKINPDKLTKYTKILILDEYVNSGESMRNMKEIIQGYFYESKKNTDIHLATLNMNDINLDNIIYHVGERYTNRRSPTETGIKDAYGGSRRVQDEEGYSEFIQNRRELSKDIKKYILKNHLASEKIRVNKLEKTVQALSIMALLGGFIFGYQGMTGNVIGSVSSSNVIGVALIVLGILGLVFSQIRIRK